MTSVTRQLAQQSKKEVNSIKTAKTQNLRTNYLTTTNEMQYKYQFLTASLIL